MNRGGGCLEVTRMGGPKALEKATHVDRLRRVAKHWGGEDVCELSEEKPSFLWLFGTTMVEATAEKDGTIQVRAYLVIGPEHRPELAEAVSQLSRQIPVGHLEVDQEGDVTLVHSIPADLGLEQMDREVHDVCRWADRLDDELCKKLGGIRSWDLFQFDVMHALSGANEAESQSN